MMTMSKLSRASSARLAAITELVHYTGGIENPCIILMLMPLDIVSELEGTASPHDGRGAAWPSRGVHFRIGDSGEVWSSSRGLVSRPARASRSWKLAVAARVPAPYERLWVERAQTAQVLGRRALVAAGGLLKLRDDLATIL